MFVWKCACGKQGHGTPSKWRARSQYGKHVKKEHPDQHFTYEILGAKEPIRRKHHQWD